MATTAREYLMFIPEEHYGTPLLTAGAPGAGYGYIRLDQGNAFTVRPIQQSINVMYGGGVPIPVARVPGNITCTGTLTTLLHYSQANTLLGWALTRINTGRTTPWATTDPSGLEPVGDLASMSFYHAIREQGGTYIKRAYRSAKPNRVRIECSQDQPLARLTVDIEAGKPIPATTFAPADTDTIGTGEFPEPTDTSYPTDIAHFFDTRGHLSIGTTRTFYRSLAIEVTNRIDRLYYEYPWAQLVTYFGRESRVRFRSLLRASPTDRADYESSTAKAITLAFNNGTHTITLNYQASNRQDTPPGDDLPIDRTYEQDLNWLNYYDQSAGTDFTFTYA